ncbi:MAG TPA: hypothetical protein PLY70_15055 [Saprospiraceae bacterium]|nr:hypothetical protein [Saprospiraceae bacterium]HPN68472.1 hypothetical protein [Saprospiraceae bacterium]
MNIEEAIFLYLPKYLSAESQKRIFEEIRGFPENLNSRFYTTVLKNETNVFQGDGIIDLMVTDLPNSKIENAKCIIISNTCDIDPANTRYFESRLTYAPIFSLEMYKANLEKNNIDKQKIKAHINAIRSQEITQIFYLPANTEIPEAIVFLDRLNNCKIDVITKNNIYSKRLFTLSNYGFYMFLLKLSMSFTRIGESVDRDNP